MRESMFEFRAGRKRVVKSVETVDEANKLMRAMIAIRNENSLWENIDVKTCLLYTSPSPRDGLLSRMPSSA